MTDDTLPPGTTHSDIDKHFGGPEPEGYIVAGDVGFGIDVRARDENGAEDGAVDKLQSIADQHSELELFDIEAEVVDRK
jgi:hypothetical protein